MYDLEKERDILESGSIEADLTPEEEYEFYKKYAFRTKADLLAGIRDEQKTRQEEGTRDKTQEFSKRLDALFDKFYAEVNSHLIMEPLDDFWGYAFEVRDTGITLMLEHYVIMYDLVDKDYPEWDKYSATHFLASDDRFSLLEVKARLLTLEEYGEFYGVGAGTVRQWIRRGKIRSAAKFEGGWRVAELVDKPGRGYEAGQYFWKSDLPDPPVELPNINDGDSLYISKNIHTGGWSVMLQCLDKVGEDTEIELSSKEKEKLELYLIGHPMVECLNNYICGARQKKGSEYQMMKLCSDNEETETNSILAKLGIRRKGAV